MDVDFNEFDSAFLGPFVNVNFEKLMKDILTLKLQNLHIKTSAILFDKLLEN